MIDERLTEQFLELVEDNKKLIYKVSMMYCDNEIDKGDLFQEIIYNLWKGFPSFRGDSKASTWVYRVSINTAISWYKDFVKSKNHIEYTDVMPHLQNESDNNELFEKLHGAIGSLGKLDKAIILLQLDGYSYDEISEIIGLTKTNVATKISRIKLKLKSYLSNN